jgi:hypothetical protein
MSQREEKNGPIPAKQEPSTEVPAGTSGSAASAAKLKAATITHVGGGLKSPPVPEVDLPLEVNNLKTRLSILEARVDTLFTLKANEGTKGPKEPQPTGKRGYSSSTGPTPKGPGRGRGEPSSSGRGGGRGTPRVPKNSRDPESETGNGMTKRTAFRKARKGISDCWNSDDNAWIGRLETLARLQLRWGSDTKTSLGKLADTCDGILEEYDRIHKEVQAAAAKQV